MRKCCAPGCIRPHRARGLCAACYMLHRRGKLVCETIPDQRRKFTPEIVEKIIFDRRPASVIAREIGMSAITVRRKRLSDPRWTGYPIVRWAKLTPAQVQTIRKSRVKNIALAAEYKVSENTIGCIKNRKTWKWVSD